MDDNINATARAATFWRLSVRGEDTGVIRIDYTGVLHYVFSEIETIETVLEKLFNNSLPAMGTPQNHPPTRSRLSIESDENLYQIFVLDTVNCQFSQDQVSFFVENSRSAFYGYPRAVWQDDLIGQIHLEQQPSGSVNATVAFFIAGRNSDPNKSPVSFNIQLDIIDPEDGGVIPISVDPDVGFPGGNK